MTPADKKPIQDTKPQRPTMLFYAIVPDYRTDDKGVVIKPAFQDSIVYKNTRDQNIDGLFTPGECKSLDSDSMGMYHIDLGHDDARTMKKHMDARVKDDRNPIIGPFESLTEALSAQDAARPKTDKELLAMYRAKFPDGP